MAPDTPQVPPLSAGNASFPALRLPANVGAEIFHRPRDTAPTAFSGERLTSAIGGQVEIEHVHRYFLARDLCRGRDVLDVACGEGYGSALLAQTAKSVVGVDCDGPTAVHAQGTFADRNLCFAQSDATALPFADACFDAVVSFETIEHFAAHEAFLAEIRRVLRPGGLLIASSPDRDHYSGPGCQPNPFHVRELTKSEFNGLLGRYFPHVATTLQRPMVGSVLMPEADGDTNPSLVFERRGDDLIRGSAGLPHAVYVVSLASDQPVALPPSLYIDSSDLDGPRARLAEAHAAMADLQAAKAAVEAELVAATRQAAVESAAFSSRQAQLEEESAQRARAHGREIAGLRAELETLRHSDKSMRAALQAAHAADSERTRALDYAVRAAASAETRLAAISDSTIWKSSWPLRRLMARVPGASRFGRRVAQTAWWTLSGQMPQRVRWWRAARARRASTDAQVQTGADALQLVAETETLPAVSLPYHAHPEVSVIVPCYGQVAYTLRCLASIAAAPPRTPFEIFVVEDCSGDPHVSMLRSVANITLIENERNLGFIRSCNGAAAKSGAEFLMFLNNDTQVQPDWLDALVDLLKRRPEAGAAGAKLVYPDGLLQEAGGIIWNDGSGWNYGRLDDPAKPVYNYVREVDYASGAALLVRRSLFEALGGFDQAYAPAYCEDSDLAFRLRAAGHQVLYQPDSVVVHFEGVSHGTDPAGGVKAYQIANTAKLRDRWARILAAQHFDSGTHVLRARDRARGRKVILVIDHYVPQPDRDAGSRTMLAMMCALLRRGRVVKFWPDNGAYSAGYTEALQCLGIEVLFGASTQGFDSWIRENGADIDGVLLSRPDVAARYINALRLHTRAGLTYYGHDLHGARMRRQAELTGDAAVAAAAERVELLERQVWRRVDVVLYPSTEEANEAAALEPALNIRAIIPYAFAAFGEPRTPPSAPVILFVAGFSHPPNEDAACWFVADILPAIRGRIPMVRLQIVGSNPTAKVGDLACADVSIMANVSDAELDELYNRARVAAVPLRYGAGVKLKVVEALARGLPLVTTPVGAQGCDGLAGVVPVLTEPTEFAEAICRLLMDDVAWQEASRREVAYARERFSEEALCTRLLETSGL